MVKIIIEKPYPLKINLNKIVISVMKAQKRYFLNMKNSTLEKEKEILNNLLCIDKMGYVIQKHAYADPGELKITKDGFEEGSYVEGERKFLRKCFNEGRIVATSFNNMVGDPGWHRFSYNDIVYPTFIFQSIDGAIEYLKQLKNCKIVVNSLFCFMGSRKIYKTAIENLKKKK